MPARLPARLKAGRTVTLTDWLQARLKARRKARLAAMLAAALKVWRAAALLMVRAVLMLLRYCVGAVGMRMGRRHQLSLSAAGAAGCWVYRSLRFSAVEGLDR